MPNQGGGPTGALGEAARSTLDGAALMVSAGAGSLAAGVPVAVMPAPLLAAGGLAMFLDSNLMRDYLLFVAGALGTGAHAPLPATSDQAMHLKRQIVHDVKR